MIDANLLLACTSATRANAERYAAELDEAATRFEILSPTDVACLLGQIAVESEGRAGALSAVEEDLSYSSAGRLREIFPSLFVQGSHRADDYVRNPARLSQLRYGGFHGRGLIQLTWVEAYRAAGEALGFDYVSQPGLVLQPWHAAMTACWFFAQYKDCLPAAERGDVYDITGRVNGTKRLKLAERKAITARALKVLNK